MPRHGPDEPTANVLCVGLGSAHGDDQFGWRVADSLEKRLAGRPGVMVRQAATPIDLLNWIDPVDELYLCDVIASAEPIGQIHRFATTDTPNQRRAFWPEFQRLRAGGTHQISLPAALDLAATLGRLPRRLVIYGVTGREFAPGRALSAELAAAAPMVADAIGKEIDARAFAGAVAAHAG